MTLDGRFFQANPPGAMIERIQGDTIAVQGVWATILTSATRDAISLVMLFAVAVSIVAATAPQEPPKNFRT